MPTRPTPAPSALPAGRRVRLAAILLSGLMALLGPVAATAAHAPDSDGGHAIVNAGDVTVGILAPRGEAHTLAQWQATLDALDDAIPRITLTARAMTLDGIAAAVAQGEVDFVLTNPGQFVLLGTPYALSWLATLRSNPANSARAALGSVLWVRAESPYRRAEQLTGRRIVAVHERAFGGYLLMRPELQAAGVDSDEIAVDFLGYPVDALVYQLRDGQAEAAIMPVCMLEQMVSEGLVRRDDFRALATDEPLGGCVSSTPAYPDWTFAALPHVSEALTGDVARRLLAMDGEDTARWGAPVSAARVATLFDDLALHPLGEPLSTRLMDALQRYWHYSVAALVLLAMALMYHAWLQRKARRHGRALEATQLALRERERELADAQSLNVSGELATTLAHELNQPLAAIRHYAEGSVLRLQREAPDSPLLEPLSRIGHEADRGAGIIDQARQWIRRDAPAPERLPLHGLLDHVRALAQPRLKRLDVALDRSIQPDDLAVLGNRLAMEQVLGNLIGNSLDAFEAADRCGWIHIDARRAADPGQVTLTIRDNAGGFSPERLARPFMPLDTTRAQGMGLGLVITRRLLQRQGGDISVDNHARGGAEITVRIPSAEASQ